jgi:Flp pilus assembly protein TadG
MVESTPQAASRELAMPRRLTSQAATCTRRLLVRWQADTRGVAAVEFALLVPIMVMMFIGAVELSQAITVDRRVTQIANATADLVARADKKISQSEIKDIMRISSYILKPYNVNPVQIVLRNVTSSPASASVTKQTWMCTYNGTGATQTCLCSNTNFTIPSNLVTTNDSVVMSQVTYQYVPLIFNFFLHNAFGGSGTSYPLAETVYLKPRSQAAMMLQTDNTTPCTSPTF